MEHALNRTKVFLAAALAAVMLALSGLAASPAQAAGACASSSAEPGDASRKKVLRATLCLLNVERRSAGLPKLRLNKRLSRAARGHARSMVRDDYFSHDSRDGSSFVDRIRRTGYLRSAQRWTVGENLAWGSGGRATPKSIMESWMASPGHRQNILTRSFREIGIGVVFGAPTKVGAPAATYATEFGARR